MSSEVASQLFCSDLLKAKTPKFYPVRHCQRSNQSRIAAKNVASVQKCAQFAIHHEAMAFNYGHGKKPRKKVTQNELLNLFDVIKAKNETKLYVKKPAENEPYFNCEVLSCPEIGNMSTMVNDTRYNYYTMYGNGNFLAYFILEELGDFNSKLILIECHLMKKNIIDLVDFGQNPQNWVKIQ